MKLPAVVGSAPTTTVTILGLGSLLSERSSKTTFPDLSNFRLGRVSNRYRRVFGHPASIFFQRGLADTDTKEFSSLSAEEFEFDSNADPECQYRGGFICSVFEVPREQVYRDEVDSDGRITTKPTGAFLEREEEFDIMEVPFDTNDENSLPCTGPTKTGTLCTRYTDEGFVERWGKDRFEENYGKYGIETIWGWERNSGLRPCRVYLRHCYLAAHSMGQECFDSFLDETFLVDRTTTIREYIQRHPGLIENTVPPPGFEERYSG